MAAIKNRDLVAQMAATIAAGYVEPGSRAHPDPTAEWSVDLALKILTEIERRDGPEPLKPGDIVTCPRP